MTALGKYYIDIYGYHMRMKNFIRLLMLIPLSYIITNVYENKTATIINLIALTIFLFFEPSKKFIIGKSIKYLVAMTLVVDIILHFSIPKANLTTTITNYSIMLSSVIWSLIIYTINICAISDITEEGFIYTFNKELLENKHESIYLAISTYFTYFISLVIWNYDYSWNIDNVKFSEIVEISMVLFMLNTLIFFFLVLFDPIKEFKFNKKEKQTNQNECKDYSINQNKINKPIKTNSVIKNSKFEQINNDIQTYIDVIAIQEFNNYEPKQHVLKALIKAKEDIQQIAQNYETRQQIDNSNNLTHYFKQAEQIKENAKDLCNEFLDYVEQHKTLSSKEEMQNIQTILEKLNDKGE